MLDLARFDDFVAALNSYVQDRGYAGRLTTPLFEIRSVTREAVATITSDMPEERAAMELSSRKRNLFHSSQHRMKETLSGLVSQATSDVTTYGDEVVEIIKLGSTEEDVRTQHEQAQKCAQERCSKLEQDVRSATEAEQRSFMQELTLLHEGASRGSFGVRSKLRLSVSGKATGTPKVSKSSGPPHPVRRLPSGRPVFERRVTSSKPLESMPAIGRPGPSLPRQDSAPQPQHEGAKRTTSSILSESSSE